MTNDIDGLRNRIIYEVCCLRPFLRRRDGSIPAGGLADALDAYDAVGHEYAPTPRLLTPGERAAAEDRGRALTRDEMIREDRKDILAKAERRAVAYLPKHMAIFIKDLAALLEGR